MLTFTENPRRYRLDDKTVPSVTTIVKAHFDKPALLYWAGKIIATAVADHASTVDELRALGRDPLIAFLTALPDAARKVAGVRGTDVHAFSEELAHGQSPFVPGALVPYVDGLARWLDAHETETLLTETPVGSRQHSYAGRFDWLMRMNDETWLIDFKTSSGVYEETILQTAGYARAEIYVDPANPDTEHAMPHVDRIGCLHLQPDGTDLYDLGNVDTAFDEFLAARRLYAGTPRRRALTKTPIHIADARQVVGL